MKVIAYSIKSFEKEFLAKANKKKHDITLISNPLSIDTVNYAKDKEAVIVFTNDDVSEHVLNLLHEMGVKYIATRSAGTDHIDKDAAFKKGFKIANVPVYSPQAIAEHALALALALSRRLVQANENCHHFDFRLDGLLGFNFFGKTVGIIGLGNIGQALAAIFNGLGCQVLGYDLLMPDNLEKIECVSLNDLLERADVISLHVPLNAKTKHLINVSTISKMKNGVMLINTSRGGLINTSDVYDALIQNKIGYLGIDVYEFEKGLFFEDHRRDLQKDELLEKLMALPNVIITPHQAFLTHEALQQIADQTIRNLDLWQSEKKIPQPDFKNV